MNENRMTTEDTWRHHWSSKKYLQFISENYSYHDVIRHVTAHLPLGSKCIELGGFPGFFSIYFNKYCGLQPTLIDFYFDEKIFREIMDFNGLRASDVRCIQHDVFAHQPTELYDLVASFGLIEHFKDLKEILMAHTKYMKPGATLLIALPNFKGINGLLQKYFDPDNLSIHNLNMMNLRLLKKGLEELGLLQIEVSYYPSTQVWIENLAERGIALNVIVRVVSQLTAFAGMLFGIKNKMLSNSIIVTARTSD